MTTLLLAVVLAQAPPPTIPAPVVQQIVLAQQEPRAGWLHTVLAAHVVAQMVDVATTEYAIGTGRFHEANPVMRWAAGTPLRMGLAKGGLAAASSWGLLTLHRQHPKLALVGTIASTAISVAVSTRNVRTLRRGLK